MENLSSYLNNLTGKDEIKAQQAACFMVDTCNIELFGMLVDKTEFLFDFVRDNVCSRIEKAVNKNNFMNLIKLFNAYSPYYDDLFAQILAKQANEDLTDEIFELLEKGTLAQKTYSAKYFSYIPDTVALEILSKYAFDDDESLAYNAAEALGQMQDDISYNIALSYLKGDDDFDKLKSVKFFTAYGKNYPLAEIFEAMKTSKMPENIAGQIPYSHSLLSLFKTKDKENALYTLDYILSGLGEILPLSDIFQFEMYEILEYLIKTKDSVFAGKIAEILLKALSKFKLFSENQEYIFDEDKNTKYEITAVFNLLKGQNSAFWNIQKTSIIEELNSSKTRILAVLPVIAEYNIKEAACEVKSLIEKSSDEIVICEAVSVLNSIEGLENIDLKGVLNKIQNPNIKAIIENLN